MLLLLASAALAAPKTVLLLVWDTTRSDHLTPYGYERDTTPNLAEIAKTGVVFDNAYAAASWTVPSVASLFTGLFTHNHLVDHGAFPQQRSLDLPDSATTIAEAMKQAGYRTAVLTAQGIYLKQDGFAQGFDKAEIVSDVHLVDKGLEWLDEGGDSPSFLVLYFLNPHSAYRPDAEHHLWATDAGDINLRGCPKKDPKEFPATWYRFCDINTGAVTLSDAEWKELQAKYDGELHQNDAELGRLWKELNNRGRLDDLAMFFTSDHGEGFNEHERARSWHVLPYDHNQHVPLIAWYPAKIPAGKHVSTQVRTIDIYASIAELTGASAGHAINGESLLPLTRAEGEDRIVVGSAFGAGAPVFMRGAGYKFIQTRKAGIWTEVYDVKKDPAEQRDLAKEMPKLSEALKKKYDTFVRETSIDLQGAGGTQASEADIEALRALGYLE